MTIRECIDALNEVKSQLDSAGVDDLGKLELEILILQIKRQMIFAMFDPLKQLEDVTIVDVSGLRELTQEVAREIANEQRRIELVQRITATAKIALKAAGLPIPS